MEGIFEDIQSELEYFFDDLNWTFIIIFVFVLYGIKNKEEFSWFNKIFDLKESIKPFKVWAAGLIIMLFFTFFKYLETGIDAAYVSMLFRSWILVIVFNSVFSDKIKKFDK